VTAKTDLPPEPAVLADVAMIDGPTCAAAGGISISSWHELVREKRAPQPVIRAVRCTRWRLADVRAWLIERAAQGCTAQGQDAARAARATAAVASQAARTKRKSATAASKAG
jgi:predicted DNA-binding transcriptional regulator AlpA